MSFAVLMDTRSIQEYIFSSNSLKDNIGASYLVEHLFDQLADLPECKEKGYCGGGNIFLQFQNEEQAKASIESISKKIVSTCPGIIFSAAIEPNFDESNFVKSMEMLHKKLDIEKQSRFCITYLPSHGITAQCNKTNLSAEYLLKEKDKKNINAISEVVYFKQYAADLKKIQDSIFIPDDSKQYDFASNLEEMGQEKGSDSHIAIVHIDGNGIGNLIREQMNLKSLQDLSFLLKNAVQVSTKKMVKNLIQYSSYIRLFKPNLLPFRPIICGGDDITFVCEGRLAISLTKDFINEFTKEANEGSHLSEKDKISCCAGIAFVKTKFPFYQAYKLAEDLCHCAKQARLTRNSTESFVDFHLHYGSTLSDIESIRKNEFINSECMRLSSKPYSITDINSLQKNADKFQDKWSPCTLR